MNKDIIEGKWDQLVGKAKAKWGDLTDDDFISVFSGFLPADKAPQVREVLSTKGSVKARNGRGGTSPARVRTLGWMNMRPTGEFLRRCFSCTTRPFS